MLDPWQMNNCATSIADAHRARGVGIRDPQSVWIAPEIEPGRIAPGVDIYPGCRLFGAETSIGPGCILGAEGPLTLENCQLERDVTLGGGFFSGCTLLAGASMGGDAHVRPGSLLEEESGGGHAVGLKQTILMPFVTLGSLINFCDCLMAGGTGPKNHGEVGSSFVHFNFTPNQDKATASLIGDVPRGVMLDQPPIFLGGQGGLVGPARIAYGTVTAAGTIQRGDQLEGGRLLYGKRREGDRAITPGVYTHTARIVGNNLLYLGNIHALMHWYRHARAPFLRRDAFGAACLAGALRGLELVRQERTRRLADLARRLAAAPDPGQPGEHAFQRHVAARWTELEPRLTLAATTEVGAADRDAVCGELAARATSGTYLDAVRQLPPAAREQGRAWLQQVVTTIARVADELKAEVQHRS